MLFFNLNMIIHTLNLLYKARVCIRRRVFILSACLDWHCVSAGSCIDGRLTSLWNWASQIEKKPYYNLFKLAGFSGFDGDFQK